MGGHLIDRVKFDIRAENTSEAKEIQDKIFSICRYQLDSALDASLAEDGDALIFREEQLILDLGHIPKDALEAQLIPRILEEFLAAISDLELQRIEEDSSVRDMEALSLFLEKGVRHWSKGNNYDPLEEMATVIKNRWSFFLRFLKKTAFKKQVSTRIVAHASFQTYQLLIQKLRPSESDFILNFTQATVDLVDRSEKVSLPKSKWGLSLRSLVLHDLIKNHDSLFNRKMFIHRQLLGLAAAHQISYLDLLNEFNMILENQELSYRYHTTLPFLIQDLSKQVHADLAMESTDVPIATWQILFHPEEWEGTYAGLLKNNWKRWVTQYPGEMKKSFEAEIRTVSQIEFLVSTLDDDKVDDVITVLLPHLSRYVIRYKRAVIKGNKESNILATAESNLRNTLNFLIVSYLTLDMGTSFNKKEFFTQQIIRLSRHYNLKHELVMLFLIDTLESSKEPILFGMLELIKQIKETIIIEPKEEIGPSFEVQDELELLFYYLKYGQLHSEILRSGRPSPFEYLTKILKSNLYTGAILDFVHNQEKEMAEKVAVYDLQLFLQLIQILLSAKVQLVANEVKIIFNQIKKHSKQAVNQGQYRAYVFRFLIDLKRKFQTKDVREYDLDIIPDPHSLLCRFLIIKLSLSEFYKEESNTDQSSLISRIKPLSYQNARDQLFAALDHLIIEGSAQEYQKNQLNTSFRKILESKQESEILLDLLNTTQLLLLFKHGNRIARYSLLKLIAMRSNLIKTLLKALKVGAVDESELSSWEKIIQLDAGYGTYQFEGQLKSILQSMKVSSTHSKEVLNRLNEIIKGRTEKRNSDMERLTGFFSTGRLPKDWNISQIEALFMTLYHGNFKQLSLALGAMVYDRILLDKLQGQLGKHVMVRWMQIVAGSEFTSLNTQIEYLEQLLLLLNQQGILKLKSKKELEAIKIHFIYAYQFRKPSIDLIVRYYMRYLAELTARKYKELAQLVDQGLAALEADSPVEQMKKIKEVKKALMVDADSNTLVKEISEDDIAPDNNYKIENAGLIIAWPFIKNLFNQLEYLEETGNFKNKKLKSQAVRLLQYVATGETTHPEYSMTLNKLLCGYPLVEPLEQGEELSTHEKNLADSMLEGVIANWDKLGNTSIEGLRSTFLLRNGSLNLEETNWILRVEKKGTDVLLDFLPWSIAGVKLPWFEGMIYVEWR